MTKLDTLVERWGYQMRNEIGHLPVDTIHQRRAYWRAHRRLRRRIRGRAANMAVHLQGLEWLSHVPIECRGR